MKSNIELFEQYIDDKLSPVEKKVFDERLHTDRQFLLDFRIFLLAVRGICMEAEQDNIEFGQSMQHLSKYELLRIIGRKRNRDLLPRISRPMSLAWAASIAVVVLIGVLSVMRIHTADLNRLDNTIVAYNYIPDSNRGWESIAPSDIPSLVKAYQQAPADDVQAQQDAGMRLAMAYLKVHDRRKAKQTLTELAERFAFDEEFAAQCQRILSQLK